MLPSHEIKWVYAENRDDLHERILFIGGLNPVGYPWKLSEEQAIKGIEEGKWSFYILNKNIPLNIVVARDAEGHKYLKTEHETGQCNNLLTLPEMPSFFRDQ